MKRNQLVITIAIRILIASWESYRLKGSIAEKKMSCFEVYELQLKKIFLQALLLLFY